MSYRIEEIEGIGPTYGKQLADVGVKTTRQLLNRCKSRSGRKKICDETGISSSHVLKWTNLADLMRINGIGKQFSELLEAAGVDTVKELKHRNPENLAAKMREVNDEKKLTRAVPPVSKVEDWISQAKTMDPVIEY